MCTLPPMGGNDFGGRRQTQPGAAGAARAVGVQPDEPIEHPVAVFGRYARAVVGDRHQRLGPLGSHRQSTRDVA